MKLFLDDIRMPADVANYIFPVEYAKLYRDENWHIVRDYDEFITYIETNEMPELISFDHDLADEHYRPSMYNPDGHYSGYYTDGTFKDKTGYDCAKWLIEYCKSHKVKLPLYICHSMNPIGKKNILELLNGKK